MADPTPTKTTNSTVKWGAIFIIGLMILSGVAVFFGSQYATNQPATPPDTNPATPEQFFGTDVQGTIVEIFNTAIVGGQTSNGDKTVFDEKLQSIPGVESVTSQFSPLNQDGSVTYIANLNLSADMDHASFADAVYALELFDAPEVYFQASAQVEAEHEVKNSNEQLTRIKLPNTQIQAIVSPLTRKGDIIIGSLAATFQGTKLVSAYLLETQNVTASPTPISFSGSFPIHTLNPSLAVTGMLDYYPGLSLESLSGDVDAIPGVSGVSVPFFPSVSKTLEVQFSDANTHTNDLNAFVTTHPESFDSFALSTSGFSVNLTNASVNEARVLLSTKINELTASNTLLSFTAPRTQFLIDANTSDNSNADIALLIQNYFNALDANASIEVYQNGTVSAESISSPDSNAVFPVPFGEIEVSVFPGHDVNDLVNVFINSIALRGELAYINGVETREEDLSFI